MSLLTLHARGMLKRRSAAYRAMHAEILEDDGCRIVDGASAIWQPSKHAATIAAAFSVSAIDATASTKTEEFRDKHERARERALHPWVD